METNNITGTQYLGYEGRISVSLVKGKKILKTKTYHNSGLPNLFKFLCMSLGGRPAESLRPSAIQLFSVPNNSGTNPNTDPKDFL